MRSHSNNNPERKAIKRGEEKCAWNYFCGCEEDFVWDECFVEPAPCLCFDDAGVDERALRLVRDEDVFEEDL